MRRYNLIFIHIAIDFVLLLCNSKENVRIQHISICTNPWSLRTVKQIHRIPIFIKDIRTYCAWACASMIWNFLHNVQKHRSYTKARTYIHKLYLNQELIKWMGHTVKPLTLGERRFGSIIVLLYDWLLGGEETLCYKNRRYGTYRKLYPTFECRMRFCWNTFSQSWYIQKRRSCVIICDIFESIQTNSYIYFSIIYFLESINK